MSSCMYQAKYFKPSEYTCKCGCGYADIDETLLRILDYVRECVKRPLVINSGCRCPNHNKSVGGVVNSLHTKGCAVDIRAKTGKERLAVVRYAIETGATGIGVHKDFIHISYSEKTQEGLFLY